MKPVKLFYQERCPFCKKALRYIEELKAEYPEFQPIEIEMIEEKVKDILKKYRNLEQKKDWKNQKLLGNDLKFSARDLINVYVELEKEFDIHFKEKDIVAGKFDTFDDIIKLINKEIAYKTRGKEHA